MVMKSNEGIIGDSVNALSSFLDWFKSAKNRSTTSLSRYTNQVNILCKCYMEDSIASDDIAIPLVGILNQIYVCWILCALGLDSKCVDGRTVSDRLQTVSGQSISAESLLEQIDKQFSNNKAGSFEATNVVSGVDPDSQRLACGRLIEFDFNAGQTTPDGKIPDKVAQLKAFFYVSLYPYFIPQQSCRDFMSINFSPSLASRFRQVRAGEISFWKDFIFCRDILKKEAELLKNDTHGIIAEMMQRQTSGVFRWLYNLTPIGTPSHNLANAMLVFNKESFDISCRENHVDFDKASERDKFFRKTFTTGVIIVDPIFGKVQMYFAGVPAVGTYSFDMINKVGSKGKDSFDLKEVMNALNSGQSPRF